MPLYKECKMKLLLSLLLAVGLIAKTVTVYDYDTGDYSTYDVQDTGTTTTIYDYDSGSYKTIYR